ncbi:MAG: type III PLP-dependent enzyme [candidate division Zixibacteria bacterium]|nr:type III PLP-dependent enzyme [candidate division Zixibacteria bacterium]
MTHSIDFSSLGTTTLLRGGKGDYVRDLFLDRKVTTPVLLISRSEVRQNYDAIRAAIPRAAVHYAVKSNNHQAIVSEIRTQGGNFDICSAAEIDTILRTGISTSEVIHSHPIKSQHEFDYAVEKGVRIFVVDNPEEVKKLARYSDTRLKILIRFRINTNTRAVVNLQYKFGCTTDEVLPLARQIKEAGHDYYGLCFHIGSQCIYPENYVIAIAAARGLITTLNNHGLPTSMLDIGGGFPVEYVEPYPPIDEFCAPIRDALDAHIAPDIKVVCEPGRYISASPVTLVCSVVGKALRDGKMWYYLNDGLYSTFSGIVFDHCQYPVVTNLRGKEKLSVLSGPTCDSFDVMYDGLMIPEHNIGDIMVFPLTGAYCAVSGSDFNSLKRPDYVIID